MSIAGSSSASVCYDPLPTTAVAGGLGLANPAQSAEHLIKLIQGCY